MSDNKEGENKTKIGEENMRRETSKLFGHQMRNLAFFKYQTSKSLQSMLVSGETLPHHLLKEVPQLRAACFAHFSIYDQPLKFV